MAIIDAVQLVLIQLALWTLVSQGLDMFLPSWLSAISLLSLVSWKFGRLNFFGISSLRSLFSFPVFFLLASAVYSGAFHDLLTSLNTALFIPLKEEIFYRFIIPKVIGKNFRSWIFSSTLVSSFLFAFAHRGVYSLLSGDMAVCLLAASALGFRTATRNKGSILESFVIHALHNMQIQAGIPTGQNSQLLQSSTPVCLYPTFSIHGDTHSQPLTVITKRLSRGNTLVSRKFYRHRLKISISLFGCDCRSNCIRKTTRRRLHRRSPQFA